MCFAPVRRKAACPASLNSSAPDTAEAASALLDQTIAPGEQLLITRKLFASGRTSVSANGQPATAGMIKQVSQLLVDIHGQHDHQYLLKPANQVLILDNFARCTQERRQFAETLRKLRDLRHQQKELTASQMLRRQQLELYEFQADEIDKIDPQPGELPELQARHKMLSNIQRIKREAGSAHAAMYETEGSIIERLQVIVHLLGDLSELDETLDAVRTQVYDATVSLEEAAFELNRYVDRLDDDPNELAEVDDRLNELNRLVQKYAHEIANSGAYADDPISAVLAYREQIGGEIERLRHEDRDLADMDRQTHTLKDELRKVGNTLSKARTGGGGEAAADGRSAAR